MSDTEPNWDTLAQMSSSDLESADEATQSQFRLGEATEDGSYASVGAVLSAEPEETS